MIETGRRKYFFCSETTQRHGTKKERDRDRDASRARARGSSTLPPDDTFREHGEKALLFVWCRRMHSHVEKRKEYLERKKKRRKRERERERERETAKTRTIIIKVPEHTSAIKGTASPASLLGTSREKPKPLSLPRRKKRDGEHRFIRCKKCRSIF